MKENKPLIAAILTMVAIYLLVSFAVWDLNAKNWEMGVRVMYSLWSPIFSVLIYSGTKIYGNNEQQ
jgi:hypothetical protein